MKKEIEALQYELNIVLEAALFYAGVKKERLEDAVDAYIECIDNVLENSNAQGMDEVIEVIEYLRKNHGDLFCQN
ncbi:hypothetical protein [Campylobacter sp. US33a]|uniref:Cell division protein n=1 Tax=Campylobacter sp. CCS1377 TaxID=3158229 RepID=A0AAU7EB01_9BACT|nr:hypothetical protein [Campylobacter sp. US33a]MCW1360585.1 hypothetical protein [Campylobacter jejuni]TEY00936.1 hypothetical protein ELQ16_08555 [Campylobacter sp. US33a]